MDQLNLFVPLKKADAALRLVYGIAAAERPDKSREIMDYASAKPAFQKWSDEIAAATDGKSLGNVRLMHTKSAIGKVTELVFNDETKEVEVCAKIVDDAAWKMVEEGVLGGFSIGGGYAKTWPDQIHKGHKRYTPALSELSLVDNPCIPGATFSLTKADGTVEEVEIKERPFEPTNDAVRALAEELAKTAGGRLNNFLAKARAQLIEKHAETESQDDPPEPTAAELLQAALEKAAGSPKPYGDVEYADAKNGKYPIDTPAHIRAAWSYVNMPKNAKVLGDQLGAVKDKIVSAWKAKIDKDGPPSAEKCALLGALVKSSGLTPLLKAIETVSLEKGFYTLGRTAHLLNQMSEIASGVIWEEAFEQDSESKLPQSILDIMASTHSFMIEMANEETAEFFAQAEKDGGDAIALLAPCLDVDGMEDLELAAKAGDLLKLHREDGALEKIGAKISSANMKHVQSVHDHAQAMGATCDSGNCDKAVSAEELKKAAEASETRFAELEALAKRSATALDEQAATIAKQGETLAKYESLGGLDLLEKVSRLPQPAKGAIFAIEKDGGAIEVTHTPAAQPTRLEQVLALPEGVERGRELLKLSGGGVSR